LWGFMFLVWTLDCRYSILRPSLERTMRPEIKRICIDLAEEHACFEFDDAIAFCQHTLACLDLCVDELNEALANVALGWEVENEKIA
jgi:hypothetical protein